MSKEMIAIAYKPIVEDPWDPQQGAMLHTY